MIMAVKSKPAMYHLLVVPFFQFPSVKRYWIGRGLALDAEDIHGEKYRDTYLKALVPTA